jgi:pimeloyl-ACP methyl ester carboxylesterase
MAFADLGDVQLFFTDEGTGDPPMLFVHGYTCDSHDWSWQLPRFAAEHRVIALDLRGHGRSSTPESGYEPLVFAADVARLVEHLGCSPVVAVGHSMGALVVSALAVEHPEMVRALVAVDPGYLVGDATVDGIPALKAAMEASDPVPFVHADPSRPPVETALFADARSKAVSWEGCGHWLHQERPAEFNALVDTWLESISSSPAGAGSPLAPGARGTS